MKVLLLSNVDMHPLLSMLWPAEVVAGEYNSVLMNLVTPASPAASSGFGRILCPFPTNARR